MWNRMSLIEETRIRYTKYCKLVGELEFEVMYCNDPEEIETLNARINGFHDLIQIVHADLLELEDY